TQPPRAFSSAATEASTEDSVDESLVNFTDYEGLDWSRVKGFAPPLSTPTGKPSWVYRHGWRIWKEHTQPEQLYFLCKYCHTQRKPGGLLQVGSATSSAITHLKADKPGHQLSKDGLIVRQKLLYTGQPSIRSVLQNGVKFSHNTYRELGNFNVQGFRETAVMWLVNNNRPLHEFETKSFRTMIKYANPEAEAALW
ncbi:hypothetical protein BU25DRAFT_315425, partial [Macroventuria anomochaeta]